MRLWRIKSVFGIEEISNKQSKIDDLQQKLDLERPLLTEELIEEKEEDIAFEQEELNTYQQNDLVKRSFLFSLFRTKLEAESCRKSKTRLCI